MSCLTIDNFLSVVIEWAASIGKILSIVVLGEKTEVLKEIGESLRERRLRLNLSQAMGFRFGGLFRFAGRMDMTTGFTN